MVYLWKEKKKQVLTLFPLSYIFLRLTKSITVLKYRIIKLKFDTNLRAPVSKLPAKQKCDTLQKVIKAVFNFKGNKLACKLD